MVTNRSGSAGGSVNFAKIAMSSSVVSLIGGGTALFSSSDSAILDSIK